LGIENFAEENFTRFRNNCKNPNQKIYTLYFRLIHNDFFTRVIMKKYRMAVTDECPRF
jgi:hypothetical protein